MHAAKLQPLISYPDPSVDNVIWFEFGALVSVGPGGSCNVNIISNTETSVTQGHAEVSIVIQNEYVEAAKAALAVVEAGKALKEAEQAYDDYNDELDDLTAELAQLECPIHTCPRL